MDKNESYFRRSFWFIWIGYLTSVLALAFISWVGTPDEESRILTLSSAHRYSGMGCFLISAIAAHFMFESLKRQASQLTGFEQSHGSDQVGRAGLMLVRYVALLSISELPGLVGFVLGFLGADTAFTLPFLGASFALLTLSTPARFLPMGPTTRI